MSDPFVEVQYGTEERSQTNIRVCDVYSEIVDVLLEPEGPTTGVITREQIIEYILNAASDFLQETGLILKLCNIQSLAFIGVYEQPDNLLMADLAMYNDSSLETYDKFQLDNADNNWRNVKPGKPMGFVQDEIEVKQIEFFPKPQFTGRKVEESTGLGFYGTLSSVEDGPDFSIEFTEPFYGVISGTFQSQAYLEGMGACVGTISSMCGSGRNFTLIGATMPQSDIPVDQYHQIIEGIPYSFVQYIKYGALARIFSTDGELKDIQRAKYCDARFTEGKNIARVIMQESVLEAPYGG